MRLVHHLGQTTNIQPAAIVAVNRIFIVVQGATGPLLRVITSVVTVAAARRLITIRPGPRPPVSPALKGRLVPLLAGLLGLAGADLEVASVNRGAQLGQRALGRLAVGKVDEAVARVARAHGVDGDVDVLEVVEAAACQDRLDVCR